MREGGRDGEGEERDRGVKRERGEKEGERVRGGGWRRGGENDRENDRESEREGEGKTEGVREGRGVSRELLVHGLMQCVYISPLRREHIFYKKHSSLMTCETPQANLLILPQSIDIHTLSTLYTCTF